MSSNHPKRELIKSVERMPPLNSANAAQDWVNRASRLRELILTDNPDRFLRWDIIQDTMFVTLAAEYVKLELEYLQTEKLKDCRWQLAIQEHPLGDPIFAGGDLNTSMNLVHMAYHAAIFESCSGVSLHSFDSILDIGGGYGCMCRFLHRLGFQGKYIMYDMPMFLELQRFYLNSTGISHVRFVSQISSLQEQISPGLACIATWSLSEIPIDAREQLMPILSKCDAFLIAYQERFRDMDNLSYFSQFRDRFENIHWMDWKIEHNKNNHYLIGFRI